MPSRRAFSLLLTGAGLWLAASPVLCAPEPRPSQLEARKALLTQLFAQLKQAPDADAATPVRGVIARVLAHHESPTAELLTSRAETALKAGAETPGANLLDEIVGLYPDWGYAWRRRAQVALERGDADAALFDLRRALSIEPRDLFALMEQAEVLRAANQQRGALELLRRASELDPANIQLREETERLAREVEGRAI